MTKDIELRVCDFSASDYPAAVRPNEFEVVEWLHLKRQTLKLEQK